MNRYRNSVDLRLYWVDKCIPIWIADWLFKRLLPRTVRDKLARVKGVIRRKITKRDEDLQTYTSGYLRQIYTRRLGKRFPLCLCRQGYNLAKVRGAFKKFCNLTKKKKGNVTNYTLFFTIIPTEFNAFATFFWQTVNSTKIEIFCLSLQPLLGSFLERFIARIADRRSESSATWHDNVKMNTLL